MVDVARFAWHSAVYYIYIPFYSCTDLSVLTTGAPASGQLAPAFSRQALIGQLLVLVRVGQSQDHP
jgi:hypothetical protein